MKEFKTPKYHELRRLIESYVPISNDDMAVALTRDIYAREEQLIDKIDKIVKRDGRIAPFDKSKIIFNPLFLFVHRL